MILATLFMLQHIYRGALEMNPLRRRSIAIAMSCIMVLSMSATVPNPTGLEVYAFVVGVFSAIVFWIQCVIYAEDMEHAA